MMRDAAIESVVLETIERLVPEYTSHLQSLVRIPSPVGNEAAAQRWVAERMASIGLDVDRFDIDSAALGQLAAFNQTRQDYRERPCVVGTRRGAGGGRSLVLNAHVDTVPVDTPEQWTHPAFDANIADGRLYGRGACDDKAGIIEILLVADALRQAGVTLKGNLIVSSVIEDERTGNGSLACVERGHRGDGVIIVDGTWPERFIVSHMGQVSFRITLRGAAGHATSAGPNPIGAIGRTVAALRDFAATRNAANTTPWGTQASPFFINVGVVRSGVWSGSIPAECVIEGQFGFPPPLTCNEAREALATLMNSVGTEGLSEVPRIEFVGLETPAEIGDPANPIARLLATTIERRHGRVLQESVIAGHCDLRHYTKARSGATAAACLYGPGGGKNIHGNDEYFELAHLPIVAGNLAAVALEWCGVAGA
jgi:acetylornithine deacetylase